MPQKWALSQFRCRCHAMIRARSRSRLLPCTLLADHCCGIDGSAPRSQMGGSCQYSSPTNPGLMRTAPAVTDGALEGSQSHIYPSRNLRPPNPGPYVGFLFRCYSDPAPSMSAAPCSRRENWSCGSSPTSARSLRPSSLTMSIASSSAGSIRRKAV